jgi:hypothetical protein
MEFTLIKKYSSLMLEFPDSGLWISKISKKEQHCSSTPVGRPLQNRTNFDFWNPFSYL